MKIDLGDLNAFAAVAQAKGFREGARLMGASASGLSEAVRRLETQLGVRLLNRTTRSVSPTEAGQRLLSRLRPALSEVEAALDVVNSFRERPAGTLKLNVPMSAARLVLPAIIPGFLDAYPEIQLEVVAEESFVDILAAGFDAGIRYDERLEQDMIADAAAQTIRATCWTTLACVGDLRAAPCRRGSSSATVKWSMLTHRARCSSVLGARSILSWTPPLPASASCISTKTGCVHIWPAGRSSQCSRHGGVRSQGRISTIRGGGLCRLRSGRSLISSRPVRTRTRSQL